MSKGKQVKEFDGEPLNIDIDINKRFDAEYIFNFFGILREAHLDIPQEQNQGRKKHIGG